MASTEGDASGEGWNLTVRSGFEGAARLEFLLGTEGRGTTIVQIEIDPSDFPKLLDNMVRYAGTCDPNDPGPSISGVEMLSKAIARHIKRERKANAALEDATDLSES